MAESEEKTASVIIKVESSSPENPKMPTESKLDDLKPLNSSNGSLPKAKSGFNIALKPSILKPPQLTVGFTNVNSENSAKPFKLNPPKLNAFTQKENNVEENNPKDEKVEKNNSKEEKVEKNNEEFSKVVKSDTSPIKVDPKNSTLPTSTVSSTSFIFGQNIKERVVAVEIEKEDPKPSTSLSTNGATDMLFSDAIKTDSKPNTISSSKENKSLVETAREYEESRAVKRKYEEVEVKTGEEDETNILCISCKLFSFDGTTGSWQERGRGTLRLNDFEADERTQSRLVFRTSGSFRVILNTKVFSSMTAEKASEKSIRLTALDANGEVKIFLVMASVEDSKSLQQHLEQRIKMEIEACKRKKS